MVELKSLVSIERSVGSHREEPETDSIFTIGKPVGYLGSSFVTETDIW